MLDNKLSSLFSCMQLQLYSLITVSQQCVKLSARFNNTEIVPNIDNTLRLMCCSCLSAHVKINSLHSNFLTHPPSKYTSKLNKWRLNLSKIVDTTQPHSHNERMNVDTVNNKILTRLRPWWLRLGKLNRRTEMASQLHVFFLFWQYYRRALPPSGEQQMLQPSVCV